jgi:magnesium-transporting ATPase (P-type)
VLLILIVEAVILVAVTLSIIEGYWVYSWFYAIYVAATVLPPLLPTVFVVSVGVSCKRLVEKKITCTDPTACLACGKVRKALFDKTGTLTESGLRFISAQRGDGAPVSASGVTSPMEPLLQLGLALCHTLTLSENGELIGPEVDKEAFSAIPNAELLENGDVSLGGLVIKFLKRFDFDHYSTTQVSFKVLSLVIFIFLMATNR